MIPTRYVSSQIIRLVHPRANADLSQQILVFGSLEIEFSVNIIEGFIWILVDGVVKIHAIDSCL